MRLIQRFWLSGPLVVRDFVAGVCGVPAAVIAFAAGCALASAGNLVWFAFWGSFAAFSLYSSVLQLQRAGACLAVSEGTDAAKPYVTLAA